MTDTVTHMVLALPRVADGLHQLMLYAVDGVALGGWQLVDLALMAVVAIELLSLIFLKVVIILLGALLYATGPITIGLVATESGAAIARAWASAVAMLIALPIVWATLFAVGALLVGDAGTAGPLIAGNSSVGVAARRRAFSPSRAPRRCGCACARRARRWGSCGCSSVGCSRSATADPSSPARVAASQSSSVDSLRRFGARVAQAASGAAGELAAAGAAGAAVVRGGRALGYLGRHGAIGTAAAGGRAAAALAAPRAAVLVGRSRAGAARRAHGESRNRQLARKPERPRRPGLRQRSRLQARTVPARGRAAVQTETKAVARPEPPRPRRRPPSAASGWPRLRRTLDRPVARRLRPRRRDRRRGKARDTERRRGRQPPQPPTPPRRFTAVAARRQAARTREAMTPTLRRLNDRERYYGLTWPGWVALAAAGGILYGAIRVSPFGVPRDRDRRRSR